MAACREFDHPVMYRTKFMDAFRGRPASCRRVFITLWTQSVYSQQLEHHEDNIFQLSDRQRSQDRVANKLQNKHRQSELIRS